MLTTGSTELPTFVPADKQVASKSLNVVVVVVRMGISRTYDMCDHT